MPEYVYAQKEAMENEAMVRTLDTQARAIWPQEKPVLAKLFAQPGLDVLDVGCGTGEMSVRVMETFAPRHVTGVDLAETHIRRALARSNGSDAFSFRLADAHHLPFADASFDGAFCRHMLQGIPEPLGVVAEMIRVVKTGGWVYFLAEDYGMLYFHPTRFDPDEFFSNYGGKAAARAGTDLRNGRKMPSVLTSLGCTDLEVQYLCIDTVRVDRELLAEIFVHWRDGFEEWISNFSGKSLEDVRSRFNDMIECTRRPDGYAAWLVPAISARVTEVAKGKG